MKFRELEVVVLERDQPEDGLCRGDLGTVVAIYEPDGVEVEFVTVTGRTHALVALHPDDLRSVEDTDLMAARRSRAS